ncbi:dynein axonemal intermediate chain 4-like [Hetaerina americana]|uniref:dynein axonemal intermediate chain 4-like n=1 Tax=Hetaerina americana TaxID=62018 RepID=UPI003A7F4655
MAVEGIAEQPDAQSLYNLELLWEFRYQEAKGKAVNCITWCKACPDLIATGYGSKGYVNILAPLDKGLLLIWSFILPKEQPLCRLETKSSVISICFHPESFYRIALGLMSGDVVLAQVNKLVSSISCIAVLQQAASFGQVHALAWFLSEQDQSNEKDPDDVQLITGGCQSTLFAWKNSNQFLISELKGIQDILPDHKIPMSVPPRASVTCIKMHPRGQRIKEPNDTDIKEEAEMNDMPKTFEYDLPHLYLVATDDGAIHQSASGPGKLYELIMLFLHL